MVKAYLGIKFHPDDRNRGIIELVSQALASCGFETICVRRDLEKWGAVTLSPQELMTMKFFSSRSAPSGLSCYVFSIFIGKTAKTLFTAY